MDGVASLPIPRLLGLAILIYLVVTLRSSVVSKTESSTWEG